MYQVCVYNHVYCNLCMICPVLLLSFFYKNCAMFLQIEYPLCLDHISTDSGPRLSLSPRFTIPTRTHDISHLYRQ